MILDRDICDLCAATYAGPTGAAWDHFDTGPADGVVWGLKRYPGNLAVVAFRGSITLLDWLRDFDFWQEPSDDVGGDNGAYPGFALGMAQAWTDIKALIADNDRLILTGHSLGAARAAVLASMINRDELFSIAFKGPSRVAARVTFGEPKPGSALLASPNVRAKTPTRLYRNGDINRHAHDLVTDVPFTGQHDNPMVDVYAAPTDRWIGSVADPFRFHHIELYQAGLAGITTGT